MNVEELLEELQQNILHDRSDRTDESPTDELWTQPSLVRYIDESQRRLALRGLVIRDKDTVEVVRVTLVEGQSEYDLHPSVLAVISAKHGTDRVDMIRSSHDDLSGARTPEAPFFDMAGVTFAAGKPIAYATDEGLTMDDDGSTSRVSLRVFPTPSADFDGTYIWLRVFRLPLERLRFDNLNAVPEIPEDHHLDMLDWAAYLALRVADVDAGMQPLAENYRLKFEQTVLDARKSAMRKLFAPMSWAVGRNGFSWSS